MILFIDRLLAKSGLKIPLLARSRFGLVSKTKFLSRKESLI